MTAAELERYLQLYAELTVRVGLNLQRGQRLLIIGPLANGGASLETAPLVRHIAASAYKAGAPLVETIWGDEPMMLARFANAAPETFSEYSAWLPKALVDHVESGGATLSVYANDPDLLKNEPHDRVGTLQQATSFAIRPFRELVSRNQTNWAVIAAAGQGWAAKVFPGLPPEKQMLRLWQEIGRLCRLDLPDPVAAWEAHLQGLGARADFLNRKHYDALKYRGPGTELTLGLPERHLWVSGRTANRAGVP